MITIFGRLEMKDSGNENMAHKCTTQALIHIGYPYEDSLKVFHRMLQLALDNLLWA
jgi:hypothetical protein